MSLFSVWWGVNTIKWLSLNHQVVLKNTSKMLSGYSDTNLWRGHFHLSDLWNLMVRKIQRMINQPRGSKQWSSSSLTKAFYLTKVFYRSIVRSFLELWRECKWYLWKGGYFLLQIPSWFNHRNFIMFVIFAVFL